MKKLEDFVSKSIVFYNMSMAEKTTLGTGGVATAYVEPRTEKELVRAVKACKTLGLDFKVIGNGSNLLFAQSKANMVVISTRAIKGKIRLHQTTAWVPSGTMASEFIVWCAERGLSGLERLFGIPATIGGMVVMNAGAFLCQMSDVVESVEVFDGEKIRIIPANELGFSRHHSLLQNSKLVVLNVEIKLERLASSVIFSIIKETARAREQKQPKGRSAGCVFKNPGDVSAGKLVDGAGLKGVRDGGAVISEKHANFVINERGATPANVLNLIDKARQEVYNKFGIWLENEIEIIGEEDAHNR